MRRGIGGLALGMFLVTVPATGTNPVPSGPTRIEIYTVTRLPVRVPPELVAITAVVSLDRILSIETELASGLGRGSGSHQAHEVERRLSPSVRRTLATTWQALARFQPDREGRLTHLPAIVLDQRAVWYGTRLRQAVTQYRHWAGEGAP